MKSFEKALDPSIRAASAVGPKTGIPTRQTMNEVTCSHTREFTFAEISFYTIYKGLLRAREDERNLMSEKYMSIGAGEE